MGDLIQMSDYFRRVCVDGNIHFDARGERKCNPAGDRGFCINGKGGGVKTIQTVVVALCVSLFSTCVLAQSSAQMCAFYKKSSQKVEPGAGLKVRELSEAEKKKIQRERACVQTYAAQFPGGLDEMQNASLDDLKRNLDLLERWLKGHRPSSGKNKDARQADEFRSILVEKWDREQPILWGTAFYMRRAYSEGEWEAVLAAASKVRQEFGLKTEPLASWDSAEENTYFSKTTLRNMIVGMEYSAKVRKPGNNRSTIQAIAKQYMGDRESIYPISAYAFNPDETVFKPLCTK
jgi:hypothetical protein